MREFKTSNANETRTDCWEHAENKPYDEFYAAVKIWGRYELVDTPSEAELIYEIGFSAPIVGTDKLTTYGPQLNRSIVDAKTHFRLWTLCEPVGGAFRKVTWDEDFADGMSRLMNDLKKISTREDTVAGSTSK